MPCMNENCSHYNREFNNSETTTQGDIKILYLGKNVEVSFDL